MQVKKVVMNSLRELCDAGEFNITFGKAKKLAELVELKFSSTNKQSESLLCVNCGQSDLYKSVNADVYWCNSCQFQWEA